MFSLSSCLQGGNEEVDNGDKKWYDSSTVYGDVYDASNDKNLYFDFSTEPKARCSFMNYCDHLQFENPDISYYEKLILMTANLTQTGIDNLQGKNLRDIKKDAVACESWNLILSSWHSVPGDELYFFITETSKNKFWRNGSDYFYTWDKDSIDKSSFIFDFKDKPKGKCGFMYDMDAFYGNYLLNGYTYAWLLTTGLNLCTQADIDKLQDKNLEQIQANEALNAILNKISNYYGGASNGYLNFFIVYA